MWTEPEATRQHAKTMKIEEIHVYNFGALKNFRLSGITPGLNLLEGPNEAGKSSVAEFIRGLFMGFRKKAGARNTYEPFDGAPRGGSLLVTDAGGRRLRLERVEKPNRKEGVLTITDEHGDVKDPTSLPIFEAGNRTRSFEALFAFDLDRLTDLDRDSLKEKIVGASMGSVGANPMEIVRTVRRLVKEIAGETGKNSASLNSIYGDLKKVDVRIREAADKPAKYWRLVEQLKELRSESERLAERITIHEASLAEVRRRLGLRGKCERFGDILEELRRIEDLRDFPADGEAQLDLLLRRRADAVNRRDELSSEIDELKLQIERLNPNEALLAHKDTIAALAELAASVDFGEDELSQAEAELSRVSENLDNDIQRLGPGWTRERVLSMDTSDQTAAQISKFAELFLELRLESHALDRQDEEADRKLDRLETEVASASEELKKLAPACARFLSPDNRRRLWRWREYDQNLRYAKVQMDSLNSALGQLREKRARIAEKSREMESPTPRLSLLALGTFAGGSLLVGLLLLMATPTSHVWLIKVLGLCAVIAAPVALGILLLRTRRISYERETELKSIRNAEMLIDRETAALNDKLRKTMRAAKLAYGLKLQLADQAIGYPQATRADIAKAERDSMAAEEAVRRSQGLTDFVARRSEEIKAEESAQKRIHGKRRENSENLAKRQWQWSAFLVAIGTSPDIEPQIAQELIGEVRGLQNQLQRLTMEKRALQDRRERWLELTGGMRIVAESIGWDLQDEESPIGAIRRWVELESEARSSCARIAAMEENLDRLTNERSLQADKIDGLNSDIERLLRSAGASDEDAFRSKAREYDRMQALDRERNMLLSDLRAEFGDCADDEAAEEIVGYDWQELRGKETDLAKHLESLGRSRDELARQSGRYENEIETLERDSEHDQWLAEREAKLALMKRAARKWIALRTAELLLDETVELCESTGRPKVVRRASELFKQVTDGAFDRIGIPVEGSFISAERPAAPGVNERLMSRATMEQLFLCLRLAHIEMRKDSAPAVPILMDDILVNFDPSRARCTARVLVSFARETRNQVLFFTCHPHVADHFPKHIGRLSMRDAGAPYVPAEAAPRQEPRQKQETYSTGWLYDR